MSVMIRLKKASASRGRYNYRVVVINKANSRDGKTIEEIGYYDAAKNPASLKIDKERYDYWVKNGAQPSDTVARLYKKIK